jgi:protein-tyrosine kinase
MSKFFQALERAEQERFLRRECLEGSPTELALGVPTPRLSPPSVVGERLEKARSLNASLTPEITAVAPKGIDQHLVSLLAPTTFEAEQYRSLRHTVEQLHRDPGALSLVAVSSPAVGDGKTTTAINLAGALAQNPEIRVLLVDMDLRRPSIVKSLGFTEVNSPGLVGAIGDPALSLEAVVRQCPPFNLAVLPAGRSLVNPYEALKSLRLGELLEEARRIYDYVVIDTPPLIPFPDCRLISRWTDGFLVVVSAHKTPRKLLEEATNVMDPAKIIGLVFNTDDQPVFGYYSYYIYGPSTNGASGKGRLGRAVQKIKNSLRRRQVSRRRRTTR